MEKRKLDLFYYHEALDRTSMMCDVIDKQLVGNKVFEENKELAIALDNALDMLYHVYTSIGQEYVKFEEEMKNECREHQ